MSKESIICYNLKDFFKEFAEYRNSKNKVATKENCSDYCVLMFSTDENNKLLKSFNLDLIEGNPQRVIGKKKVILDFSQVNYPIKYDKIDYYNDKLSNKLGEIWEKGSIDTSSLDWSWFLENEDKVEPNKNSGSQPTKPNHLWLWISGGVIFILFIILIFVFLFRKRKKKSKVKKIKKFPRQGKKNIN